MTMLLAILGCASPDASAPDDSASPAADTCSPYGLTLAQTFAQEDLPNRAELDHAEPGVALGDLDGDGDLDALVAWTGGSFGLRNDGGGLFTLDEAIDFDGGEWPGATAVALADLDADGDLDGYLGHWDATDKLVWNDGTGHFTGESLAGGEAGSASWSGMFGDVDGDDDLDLYVAARVPDIDPELVLDGRQIGYPNYLYRNDGGVFTRDDTAYPPEDNFGLTFQGAFVDVDADGDLDIYEANDWGFYVTPNRLLLNDGTGHYTVDDTCACDLAMYGMGIAVGDYQGDGWPDLYVTDIGSPNLLTNLGDGTFADSTLAAGAYIPPGEHNYTSWGTGFGDLDRDGCSDLVVAYGRLGSNIEDYLDEIQGVPEDNTTDPDDQVNVVLLGDCGGFTRATEVAFDDYPNRDRSIAMGDLDGDGRTDMISTGKNFVSVWHGEGGCDAGLTVELNQAGLNAAGIGSKVRLTAGGQTQTQWMLPATLHSASALELTFGLAGEGELEVTWPDGTVTTQAVEPGRLRVER